MMKHRTRIRHGLLAAAALLAQGASAAAPDFDPARLGWTGAQMRASKLLVSVEADVSLEVVDADRLLDTLMTPAEGSPIAPANRILAMRTVSRGLGRATQMELLIDPYDGRAFQRTTHDADGKYRHRIYRYTDEGAFHRTWWPEKGEQDQPWQDWSEQTEGLRAYPPGLPAGPVSEPTALIYLVGASQLAAPGDRTDILTFARRSVHRVTAEVVEPREIRYAFRDSLTGEQREGRMRPIQVRLRGATLDAEDDEFELLGLSGDIDLYLDPATRAPLQLSGRVRIFGQVDFRLAELTRPGSP